MIYDIARALNRQDTSDARDALSQGLAQGRAATESRARNALTALQIRDTEFNQGRRAYAKGAIEALKNGGTFNPEDYAKDYMSDAAKAGDFEAYIQASNQIGAASKAQREQEAARLTGLKTKLEVQGQLLGSVRDQASYDAARAQAQQSGLDISQLPDQYSPQTISTLQQQGLSAAQQVEQEWKAKGYGLDVARFNYQQRNDAANRNVTLLGQQRADAHAQLQAGKPQLVQTSTGYEWIVPGQVPKGLPKGVAGKGSASTESTLRVIDEAEKLIPSSTGSYLGSYWDQGARLIGKSTEGADKVAKLKVLESKLVQAMPKMSGPQSDRDVQLYREAAGMIGDPTIPNSQKLAAMSTLKDITARYKEDSPVNPELPVDQSPSPTNRPSLDSFRK